MFFRSSYNSMKDLCDGLKRKGYIQNTSVYNALMKVDRIDFSPRSPYEDSPQPINYNVTISAPHMHAYCLELLKDYLKPGQKALDVGFGSGYLTVAMSKMMEDKGLVVGIEHIKELCDFANENISKSHKKLLDEKKIVLIEGDGREGYKSLGPYNCIHVGAASEKIPKPLIDQLALGGRLVVPVGRQNEGQYITTIIPGANNFVDEQQIEENEKIIDEYDIIVLQLEIPIETVEYVVDIAYKKNKIINKCIKKNVK